MINKLQRFLTLLFSKRVEGDTEEVRALERKRRIAQSAAMGLAARSTNILSGLLTVPLTLPYLGLEQFGIWMAITGFVSFLSFTDLGISVGLQSKLTNCDGRGDISRPSYYISSAIFLFSIITSLLVFIAIFVLPKLDLTQLVRLDGEANRDILLYAFQAFILTFALGMPAGLIQRMFEAYQDGFYSNTCLLIGRIFSFLSIFVSIHFDLGLPLLIALYMGCPFVFLIIGGLWLFKIRKWLRPSVYKIEWQVAKDLMQVGGMALCVQVGFAVMTAGPLIVLVGQFGAEAIVPFSVTQRIFSAVSLILAVILNPLWPAYGEALGKGDWKWLARTYKRSFMLVFYVTMPIFIIFTFGGQAIISIWTQDPQAVPEWQLLMICNIWMILLGVVRILCMFLNGVERFKYQAVYNLFFPVVAIYLGWQIADSMSLVLCLAIMVLVGELPRVMCMLIESGLFLKKGNKNE
jgi:O-antigen/teichoic acid export membrane protein